jgi:hypothetical protein
MQDTSDSIFVIAKDKFKQLREQLTQKGLLSDHELAEKDGLLLTLVKSKDSRKVEVYIYPGGEVFSRKFNDSYETFQTAYDMEDKTEILDDLVAEAAKLMNGQSYLEEIYEKQNRIIFRKLVYADGSHEPSSQVFLGRIRRYFGCKKKTIKYD